MKQDYPRIAYLILAHRSPSQLNELVRALRGTASGIFIHVDLKARIEQFEAALRHWQRVVFVTKRTAVWHLGYSTVLATLELLRTACAQERFDYYVLLSGDDYPIKRDDEILQFFSKQNRGFIGHYEMRPGRLEYGLTVRKRYQDFFLFNERWAASHKIPERLSATLERLAMLAVPDAKPALPVYRGSQWWGLPHDMVTYVLSRMESLAWFKLRWYFRFRELSDEMLIHTLLLNSPFRERCFIEAPENKPYKNICPLHYIDWSPRRETPAHLGIEDWEKMKNSKYLFARKFVSPASSLLQQAVDEYRRTA